MTESTSYRRPLSALGHILLFLFSLGFLGVTSRSCAVGKCTPKLAFLVATACVSTIFSLLVTILQCIELRAATLFVWSIDVALLLWWCVAVALSSLIIESNASVLSQPILGFAWICTTLTLILSATSIISAPCTNKSITNSDVDTPSPNSSNDTNVHSNHHSNLDLPNERDYVPEDRYMGPATGDPNYNAKNLIGDNAKSP